MRRAFTVLEVMIALAIFAMAATILGTSYVNVLNAYESIERAGENEEDIAFARTLILTEADRDTVEKGGQFETAAGRRFQWRAKIEPTDIADLFDVAYEYEIAGQDLKQAVRARETIRVLRPTWSKPDERDKLRAAARDRIVKLQGKLK